MHPRRPTSVPGSQPSDPGHASRPRLTCPGHPAIRRGTREPPVLEASRRGSTTLPHVARCRTPGARRRFRVQPRADRARRQVPGDTQTMLTRARGTDSTTLLVTDRVEPSRSDGTLRIEPTPIGGASTPAPPTPRRRRLGPSRDQHALSLSPCFRGAFASGCSRCGPVPRCAVLKPRQVLLPPASAAIGPSNILQPSGRLGVLHH